MSELHGVETIELTSGATTVTTIETAVIGLVGTAPSASTGSVATGTAGTSILDNLLTFTASSPGADGNQFTVTAESATPDVDEPVAVVTSAAWSDNLLLIVLGCDESGVVSATAAEVVAAVQALEGAGITVSGTGSGVVSAFSIQLSGGADEPFPLYTPVAIVGTSQISSLGSDGSLSTALEEINDQRNALAVIVRVEESDSETTQRAAILKGISALSKSKSVTAYQPRILIAPGFSEDDSIGKALETMAGKLRAIAYVDCASMATLQQVVERRQTYGSRTELLRPRVQVTNSAGELVYRPYSAFAAGLRARIDYENGWWWSKSNQTINSIVGLEQIDEFILGEVNCDANQLNMQNVTTIIRRSGFRHWGNRLCTTDTQWRFESVRRSADVIEDSIQDAMMDYVDRPLDRNDADDILETINSYMRSLVSLGAIFGGTATLDDELNTADTMAAGVLYIDYDFGPKSPTERISLRVKVNNNYAIEELTA